MKCVSWMWRELLAPEKDVSIEGCDQDQEEEDQKEVHCCITVAADTQLPTPLDLTPLWFGSLAPRTV